MNACGPKPGSLAGQVFVRHPERPELRPIQTGLNSALAIGSPAPGGAPAQKVIETLIRAGQELSAHWPLGELLELILDLARDAVKADRGVLMLIENEGVDPPAGLLQDLRPGMEVVRPEITRMPELAGAEGVPVAGNTMVFP